jgi:ATP-binding cassette subfamily B protein
MNGSPAKVNSRRLVGDGALWSRIWTFGRPHRRQFFAIATCGVLATLILLSYPLIYGALVNNIAEGRGVPLVGLVIAGLLALTLAHVGLRLGQAAIQARATREIGTDLQTVLFDRLQRQSVGFFSVSNAGAITARTVDEAAGAAAVFGETMNFFLTNVVTLALTTVALLVIDWRTIVPIVFLAVTIIPIQRFEHRYRAATLEQFHRTAEVKSFTAEKLNASGNQLTKLDGDYERETAAFRSRAQRVWDVVARLDMSRAGMASVIMFAVNIASLVLLFGTVSIGASRPAIGTVVALIVYLRMVEGPLAGIAEARLNIARDLIAFTRVFEVLDAFPLTLPPKPANESDNHAGLTFEHVSYVYPRRAELAVVPTLSLVAEPSSANPSALHDVSFAVAPGQIVALVGRSGAGKSTIARLAAGLLTPTDGRITLDGSRVGDAVGAGDAHRVAYVTQDTYLLHGSLRANVLYARPEASERELRDACVAAGVHDFAWDLPRKYETVIGENGTRLSGGERQRIALARALLHDPALVILDEATAHMDTKTEQAVQAALSVGLADRARLIVAHRLSTIQNADLILVIDNGAIAERGTHDELLAHGGLYAELYRMPFVSHDVATR